MTLLQRNQHTHHLLEKIFLKFMPIFLSPNWWNTTRTYIEKIPLLTSNEVSRWVQHCLSPMPNITFTWENWTNFLYPESLVLPLPYIVIVSCLVHLTILHMDDLLSKIQQDPELSALEEPVSTLTSSSRAFYFGKKVPSEEVRSCRQAKWWQD